VVVSPSEFLIDVNGTLVQNPNVPHLDNFLVPLLLITLIVLLVLMVGAWETIRRKYFEVFYYTHMFSYIIIASALLHAWALWCFLCGGLTLYYIDRLARFYSGCKEAEVVEASVSEDEQIVKLELDIAGFNYEPGQYAFVNIPDISPLQWHPFSMSSSPLDDHVTFHIKHMGHDTWTARLLQLAKKSSAAGELRVNVEGAYGRFSTLHHSHYDAVVLVAGGIGITPLHAFYRYLYHQKYLRNSGSGSPADQNPKAVYLYWMVRDGETLHILSDSFNNILAHNPDNSFRLRLYGTRTPISQGLKESLGPCAVHYRYGRPDFDGTFAQIRASHAGEQVAVMVCGPHTLIDSVSQYALSYHFDFHPETFLL